MSTEAKRKCNAKYQKKLKTTTITFNLKELEEYEQIKEHCQKQNRTMQAYIKWLIREDMKKWE